EGVGAVFDASCAIGAGPAEFRRSLLSLVPEPESLERAENQLADFLVYRPEPKARPWRLLRTERGFRVQGTPPPEDELERVLKAAGAKRGATVEVGDEAFELA